MLLAGSSSISLSQALRGTFGCEVQLVRITEGTYAMGKLDGEAPLFPRPERKYRRFNLQHAVRLKVRSADSIVELDAVCRNIGMGGVLLETSSMIPQNALVSFIITVLSARLVRPIRFVGEGKVVRVDAKATEEVFAIAVECERPIIRTDDPLGMLWEN